MKPSIPKTKAMCIAVCLTVTMMSLSQASNTDTAEEKPGDEPKAKVPPIVAALFTSVASSFGQSLINRFIPTTSSGTDINAGQVTNQSDANLPQNLAAPCYYTPNSSNNIGQILASELKRTGCTAVAEFVGVTTQNVQNFVSNIVPNVGQVPAALSYNTQGFPNYQGIKVSALIVDNSGKVLEERPIGNAFYTGEKFRLRVQSSFAGFLEVMHASPTGAVKRLFPKPEIGQFMINAGTEVSLPLGNNAYEFAYESGIEQLTIRVRDPRADSSNQGLRTVYRQDTTNGSFYAQPTPEGQFPVISQTVQILHKVNR